MSGCGRRAGWWWREIGDPERGLHLLGGRELGGRGVPRNRVALEMGFWIPVSCRALYSALFCASFPQPCEVNKHDVAIPSQRGSGHPDPVFPKFRMYRGLIPGVEPGLTPATLLFSAGPSAFFGLVVTLIGETSPQQVGF